MIANFVYVMALGLLSPFILYRVVRHGRYRRGVAEKLLGLSRPRAEALCGNQRCVWFHAVSVGEVNLLPGLIRQWQQQVGDSTSFVVSTSTDTGYDLAIKHFGEHRVFFCPLDFSWAVKRTLRNLNPTQLVLAELELWPNLIRSAKRRGCGVHVVNARLSDRSAKRYQQFSFLTRRIFSSLDWVGCQDEVCRDHFAGCGTATDRIEITGSLKFDDAPQSRTTSAVKACRQWAGISQQHQVWLVGSTQPGEEDMAIQIYRSLQAEYEDLRLIIVPRHRERFDEVANLIVTSNLRVRRRSRETESRQGTWESDEVILIDTIGELRNWWGTAQIATVGGSFGNRGGQNMLEPAGYGCAVSFGPDTRNFRQIARGLLEEGAAARVMDLGELDSFVRTCLHDPAYAEHLGRSAKRVVRSHQGATVKTVQALAGAPRQFSEKAA